MMFVEQIGGVYARASHQLVHSARVVFHVGRDVVDLVVDGEPTIVDLVVFG